MWLVAVILGLVNWVGSAFAMNPDGISYLRLADLYARGEWSTAVDACWSPLYPLVLAGFSSLIGPSQYWEVPLVHAVNFISYVIAFAAFRYLLQSVRTVQRTRQAQENQTIDFGHPAEWLSAYALFFSTSLVWIGLKIVTPDLLVAAVVYAACGLALRLRQRSGFSGFLGLGAIAALGYLTKAVMFPLGVLFLLVAAFTPWNALISTKRVLFAFLGFFVVAGPQIASVSRLVGHVAYADTGQMAYAREVNGYPTFWVGVPSGSGQPEHPVRQIHENPNAYEFAVADARSSYPFWDRPAYWTAGIRSHFDLAQQLDVTRPILLMYLDLLEVLLFAVLVLLLLRGRGVSSAYLVLILPALGAFGLYALVFAEPRYLGAWAVVLFIGTVSCFTFPAGLRRGTRAVLAALALFEGVAVLTETWDAYKHSNEQMLGDPSAHLQLQIASRLHSLGLAEGSRVASVGYAFDGYWARLAGVQIAMEVPDNNGYWTATDSVKLAVNEKFRKAGAVAIVANRVPSKGPGKGWISVGLGRYYVLPLDPAWAGRHSGNAR